MTKKLLLILAVIISLLASCKVNEAIDLAISEEDPLAPYLHIGDLHNYFLEQTAVSFANSDSLLTRTSTTSSGDWSEVAALQKNIIQKSSMSLEERTYGLNAVDRYMDNYDMDFLIRDIQTNYAPPTPNFTLGIWGPTVQELFDAGLCGYFECNMISMLIDAAERERVGTIDLYQLKNEVDQIKELWKYYATLGKQDFKKDLSGYILATCSKSIDWWCDQDLEDGTNTRVVWLLWAGRDLCGAIRSAAIDALLQQTKIHTNQQDKMNWVEVGVNAGIGALLSSTTCLGVIDQITLGGLSVIMFK